MAELDISKLLEQQDEVALDIPDDCELVIYGNLVQVRKRMGTDEEAE